MTDRETARAPDEVDWTGLRVLVLDRDDRFRLWLRKMLLKRGVAHVVSVPDADDAKLFVEAVDVCIIGLCDDARGGAALLAFIRDEALCPVPRLPVLVIVGAGDEGRLERANELGIQAVASRPLDELGFLAKVAEAVLGPLPVVAGPSYIGPERRRQPSADYAGRERRCLGPPVGVTLARGGVPAATGEAKAAGSYYAAADTGAGAPTARQRRPAEPAGDWAEQPATPVAPAEADPFARLERALAAHELWLSSRGASGERADLRDCDLTGAVLAGRRMSRATLRGCDLSGADLSGALLDGADLRSACLFGARLDGANLGVGNLRHAVLRGARLGGCNLKGADLAGADLRDAAFEETDLGGANLLGADIRQTDLRNAHGLRPRQLTQAVSDETTQRPYLILAVEPAETAGGRDE